MSSIKMDLISFSKLVRKNMSELLAESLISLEQTLVYQTVFESIVALIQQKIQGDFWQTYRHCLIPKLFLNLIASLPDKTKPAEPSYYIKGTFTSKSFAQNFILTWSHYLTTFNEFSFITIAIVCLCLETS